MADIEVPSAIASARCNCTLLGMQPQENISIISDATSGLQPLHHLQPVQAHCCTVQEGILTQDLLQEQSAQTGPSLARAPSMEMHWTRSGPWAVV